MSEHPPRYRIYRGCDQVFTALSIERVVAVLLGHLEDFLPETRLDDRHLQLQALALVHGQEAVLVPHRMLRTSPTLEARLALDAVTLLERTSVIVDPDTRELVVPPSSFALSSQQSSEALRAVLPAQTAPGRYALKGWLILLDRAHSHLSPGLAIAAGMSMARHQGEPTRTLQALTKLAEGLPVFAVANSKTVIACVRGIWS